MTGWLVLLPLAAAGVPAGRALWCRRHRAAEQRRRQEQLPDALERMAGALRTGSSLAQALTDAGSGTAPPLGPELAELAATVDRGSPLPAALRRWARDRDDAGTRLAATALILAGAVGAAPARAVDGVAATLRERLTLAAERRAQATQARYSAAVLSVAPLGFTALLVATNRAAADFLLTRPAGWACLLVGLALDGVGAVWMTHLTRAGDP